MNNPIPQILIILQLAASLLTLVQNSANLPDSFRQQAIQIATNAVSSANNALKESSGEQANKNVTTTPAQLSQDQIKRLSKVITPPQFTFGPVPKLGRSSVAGYYAISSVDYTTDRQTNYAVQHDGIWTATSSVSAAILCPTEASSEKLQPQTNYTCVLNVIDQWGNVVSQPFSFSTGRGFFYGVQDNISRNGASLIAYNNDNAPVAITALRFQSQWLDAHDSVINMAGVSQTDIVLGSIDISTTEISNLIQRIQPQMIRDNNNVFISVSLSVPIVVPAGGQTHINIGFFNEWYLFAKPNSPLLTIASVDLNRTDIDNDIDNLGVMPPQPTDCFGSSSPSGVAGHIVFYSPNTVVWMPGSCK